MFSSVFIHTPGPFQEGKAGAPLVINLQAGGMRLLLFHTPGPSQEGKADAPCFSATVQGGGIGHILDFSNGIG